MKIAPLMRAFARRGSIAARLIHTGQHFDASMKDVLFADLEIPRPDIDLGVAPGAAQTARIMIAIEPVLAAGGAHLVVVVGDVNSTLAAALAAAHLGIPIAHVEAGLRSFDRSMPEEINRLVTDRLAALLYASEPSAISNLCDEGIAGDHVVLAGNVMIDTLEASLDRAVPARATLADLGAGRDFPSRYGLVTLHRPSNVDDPERLTAIVGALSEIADAIPLVFSVHPRTEAALAAAGLHAGLAHSRIRIAPPLGYLRNLGLMREATLVITDSGGMQEETTALGIPCLTVRATTERPVTVSEGTNVLVGVAPDALVAAALDTLRTGGKRGRAPDLWDGQAAERIVAHIEAFLKESA